MKEEVIPIKKEVAEEKKTESSELKQATESELLRALIPINTATTGRPVKLRDLFNISGSVASDSTVVTVTATGIVTCDATRTVVLRIGSGLAPTTEWNSMTNVAGALTDAPWNLTWIGIVTTLGASGTIEGQMTGAINNVGKDDANTAAVALATNTAITVALTADWSANTAGNSISVRQWL